MTKYRIRNTRWNNSPFIEKVEIERETDKCVWHNGVRHVKDASWFYLDSWEEAKAMLVHRQVLKVEVDLEAYRRAKEALDEICEMREDG